MCYLQNLKNVLLYSISVVIVLVIHFYLCFVGLSSKIQIFSRYSLEPACPRERKITDDFSNSSRKHQSVLRKNVVYIFSIPDISHETDIPHIYQKCLNQVQGKCQQYHNMSSEMQSLQSNVIIEEIKHLSSNFA